MNKGVKIPLYSNIISINQLVYVINYIFELLEQCNRVHVYL